MSNDLSVKKLFLYNKDLHKQVNKKENNKRLIWIIISIFIIAISTIVDISIIKMENASNYLYILYFILMLFGFTFIFVFIYNFWSLCTHLSQKMFFSDRCYALTNNNEFISFKYAINSTYFRTNLLRNKLLDDIIRYLVLKTSIDRETKEAQEKLQERNVALDDLYECINIINVYTVKEKEEYIEFTCDYIDLIRNLSAKNQKITIYKYFDNWSEILTFLNKKKLSQKKQINQQNGEKSGFIDFIIRSSSRKSNAIWFHGIMIYALIDSIVETNKYGFIWFLQLAISILCIILFSKKLALKCLYEDVNSKKDFLKKKITTDKVFIVIYSLILFIYLLFNLKYLAFTLISGLIMSIIVFIFIKKLER